MFDILSIIPGKKKTTSSGWHSFNAICCSHLGHKPDRRMRGGIKFDGQTNWSMHCFNCGYKCNFVLGRSIIIPYTYNNKIVGHTSRFLDNKIPKYINEQQPGYVFNIDVQKSEWQVCILTEGIFDALSIDGIAIMHDDISNDQAQLIASLNKQIIVVPDRDKTGLKLCDRALELGYSVSLPNWELDIKDVNDAVVRYGKLPTLLSILQSATMSKIKIEMQRKKIEKTIR